MKQISQRFLLSLLLAFLLFSHSSSARILASKQGEQSEKLNLSKESATHVDYSWTDFHDLKEKEQCEEEDEEEEECEKRRMMEDAHLDYVYTQNERP